jgi:hypothetical protein
MVLSFGAPNVPPQFALHAITLQPSAPQLATLPQIALLQIVYFMSALTMLLLSALLLSGLLPTSHC